MKPKFVYSKTNYTIYVPDYPDHLVIYFHPPQMPFPHSNGRKSRTKYNFQEEIAQQIFDANPNTVVAVAIYSRDFVWLMNELVNLYKLTDVAVMGWSLGGNSAVKAATEIKNVISLTLIDANHTNQMNKKYFDYLRGTTLIYVSNNDSPAKLKKVSKAFEAMPEHQFIKVPVPIGFKGSIHRFCRDYYLDLMGVEI